MEKRNVLIMYQGGGYDGCFWEYNYCYINKEGEFEDIHSSGYRGIKDVETLDKKIEHDFDDYDFDFYYLDNEEDLARFQKEANEGHIVSVISWFNEHYPKHPLYFICQFCGDKCREGIAARYVGCGGISSRATLMICEDCYSNHLCGFCGEIYEGDLIAVNDTDVCPGCVKDYKNYLREMKKTERRKIWLKER